MTARLSDPLPGASSRAAAAASSRTPPPHPPRPGRTLPPPPSRPPQRARATAAPYRQARHHMARLRHQRRDATRARVRPIQARSNSGEYPLSPEGAKPLLSRADLLPSCYQDALPSTLKYPYLYSNYFHEMGGGVWSEPRRPPANLAAADGRRTHLGASAPRTPQGWARQATVRPRDG